MHRPADEPRTNIGASERCTDSLPDVRRHTTPAGSRLFADLVVRQLATRRRARAAVTTDEDDLHGTRDRLTQCV